MKLTKMVYIASPYTAKGWRALFVQYKRFFDITRIIGRLQDQYKYAFIAPITQSHMTAYFMTNQGSEFSYWRERDLTYISRCDEVWVVTLDGWEESVGVTEECRFAREHKIKIKLVDPITLKVY